MMVQVFTGFPLLDEIGNCFAIDIAKTVIAQIRAHLRCQTARLKAAAALYGAVVLQLRVGLTQRRFYILAITAVGRILSRRAKGLLGSIWFKGVSIKPGYKTVTSISLRNTSARRLPGKRRNRPWRRCKMHCGAAPGKRPRNMCPRCGLCLAAENRPWPHPRWPWRR